MVRIFSLVLFFSTLTCIKAYGRQSADAVPPAPRNLTEPIAICNAEHTSEQQTCLFFCNSRRRPTTETCIVPPKPIFAPFPEYADKARKERIEGTVELQITVDTKGKVTGARITRSLDPSLDKKSLGAVRKWRFEPATLEGRAVAVTMVTETSFHIRN